jgi:hypothetical protein
VKNRASQISSSLIPFLKGEIDVIKQVQHRATKLIPASRNLNYDYHALHRYKNLIHNRHSRHSGMIKPVVLNISQNIKEFRLILF